MKKLRYIKTAEDSENLFEDLLRELKEDFDYIISGLEKLDRTSATASNKGQMIAEKLQSSFQEIISDISDTITEGE